MIDKFQAQKEKQLARKDLSNEQQVDLAIRKLCNKINSKKEYYTTSSCAGRIVLIKSSDKKIEDVFLFKTHSKINFKQLKKAIEKTAKIWKKLAYFKQETCILHVACENLEFAQELVNKAKFAGWKRSGIMASKERIICELMSTEKLELPTINNGKLLVNDEFLKILVKEANRKLEKVHEKIQKFEKLI